MRCASKYGDRENKIEFSPLTKAELQSCRWIGDMLVMGTKRPIAADLETRRDNGSSPKKAVTFLP